MLGTKKISIALAGIVMAASVATSARAASVIFTNTSISLTGTGNGTVMGILSLQQHGSDTTEYGFTGWNPNNTGDAGAGTSNAQTQYILHHTFGSSSYTDSQNGIGLTPADYFSRSQTEVTAAGINASNFGIVFQVNESNGSLTLNRFNVNFYNADGTLDFTAHFPDPPTDAGLLLSGVGQGTSGWVFAVINFANPTETSWFTTPGGYVGLDVAAAHPVLNTDAGADNFFLTQYTANNGGGGGGAGNGAPMPAAVWGGLAMITALGMGRMIWRKKAVAS